MAKKENLEVAVQQPAQPPATLYNLVAYMKALASMEEVPAELEAAFEAECRTALNATADKIDAVHRCMFIFAAQAEAARGAAGGYEELLAAELEREQKRAGRYEAKLENLRRTIMEVGVMRGLYIGEGDKRKPAPLQGNVATFQFDLMAPQISEEGFDEALVPVEFKRCTVTVSEADWKAMAEHIAGLNHPSGVYTLENIEPLKKMVAAMQFHATVVRTVDRKALLAALKQPCRAEGCVDGKVLVRANAEDEDVSDCQKCGGTGRRKIPGAKLEVGRVKLVVK